MREDVSVDAVTDGIEEGAERMMRPNWLDPWVERFQHNWETNPRFRAIISGLSGLLLIALTCTTMAIAASFADAFGGALSGSPGSNGNYIGSVAGSSTSTPITFPVKLATPWPSPQIPGSSPLGPSLTPQPTATFQPTATPKARPTCDPSGCGGGGGGGGGGSVTGSSPSPLKAGATGSILIHTDHPNTAVVVNITWPNGANDFPAGSGTSDASGDASIGVGTVPSCSPTGSTKGVTVHVLLSDGSQFSGTVNEKC